MKVKIFCLLILLCTQIQAKVFNLKNDFWSSASLFDKSSTQKYHLGIQYKPTISLNMIQKEAFEIDCEVIADLSYKYIKNDSIHFEEKKAEIYRGWIRYSGSQFEARVGLQKINFGPAQLLRSLKWFDTIDPRDPQEETGGVQAVLFRYYFLNNANIWFWGIYAKDELKGLEVFPSKEDSFEFGGRIQYPFEFCEAALSYHHRELENTFEDRLGFDARWDFEMGLWIEAVAAKYIENTFTPNWEKFLTLGADYTIPLGNGIHILGEHFVYSKSEGDLLESSYKAESSAISLNYPIGLFDNIVVMIAYDWESENWSRFLSYQRNYNYLSIYLNLSWNPEMSNLDPEQISTDGKSVQM
ncbi:MAG: hypothetical protein KAW88_07335, partial [Candidatus Cloacimonetes bacterium]|nr:hypothetical protein [Candidatus Cloacimonadota bacterium]